jgi:hypothetical protein
MARETPRAWVTQDDALSGVEVVRRGGGRQKCFLHAAFPDAGLYRIILFFNGRNQDTIYIDSSTRGSEVRPTEKADNDHGLIPIIPRSACVAVRGGQLRIAFAAFAQHTYFEARVMTHVDKPFKGSFTIDQSQTTIPCDESRRLTDFRITFSDNNECTVRIYVSIGGNKLAPFVEYQVTVTGITPGAAPAADRMEPIDMNEVNHVVGRALDQDEFDDLRDFYETHRGPVAECLPPRSVSTRRRTAS